MIFADSQSKIENCLESERLRLRDTAFTRSRKLTAKIMLYLILHRIYTSLQLDLDDGPLDHIIYDCQINSYKKDERDLARLHVKRLDELGLKKSLLLFDRWYPSAEFISFLLEKGFHFVMRARSKWSLMWIT